MKEHDGDGDGGDKANEDLPHRIADVTFHIEFGLTGVLGHQPAREDRNANSTYGKHEVGGQKVEMIEKGHPKDLGVGPEIK